MVLMPGIFRPYPRSMVLLRFSLLLTFARSVLSILAKGTIAWPGTADFDALNKTLGGSLQIGRPLAAPCFSNYDGTSVTPDSAECSIVQSGYTNETFIAQHFGGYQNVNWASCQSRAQECAFNFSSPTASIPTTSECYQGSVPNYYVPVQKVEDVQAVLSFVSKTGVPLVIKNTGHDFKGRSSGPGSIALWTYPYKPAITLTKDFIPEGCSAPVGERKRPI
jgi:hypothetical protein